MCFWCKQNISLVYIDVVQICKYTMYLKVFTIFIKNNKQPAFSHWFSHSFLSLIAFVWDFLRLSWRESFYKYIFIFPDEQVRRLLCWFSQSIKSVSVMPQWEAPNHVQAASC